MNKIVLFCFAVLLLLVSNTIAVQADESAKQTQADVFGNASGDLTTYLKRPTTQEQAPDANGFIRRWLLLEPIRQSGLRSNQQLTDSFR